MSLAGKKPNAKCGQCGKDWYVIPSDLKLKLRRSVSRKIFCTTDCYRIYASELAKERRRKMGFRL